jgi:hypothetical protein
MELASNPILLGIVAGALVVAGFALSTYLAAHKSSAEARILQGIDALVTEYEHLTVAKSSTAASLAADAANAARFKALVARIGALPPA